MNNSEASGILGSSAIPGNPGLVRDLASQLSNIANQVGSVRQRLTGSAAAEWTGLAEQAFRQAVAVVPPELAKVTNSYQTAAYTLNAYAGTLEGLQSRAQTLAANLEGAQRGLGAANSEVASTRSDLRRANLAHAVSVDPVSKANTQANVNRASAAAAGARARQQQFGDEVSGTQSQAMSNRQLCDAAVARCVAGLNQASQEGIRNDLGSFASRYIFGPGEQLLKNYVAVDTAFLAAAWGLVKGVAESIAADAVNAVMLPYDLVKLAEHPSLEQLGHVLDDAAGAITVVALVALAVTTGGAGDVALAGAVDAAGTMGDAATVAGAVVDGSKAELDLAQGKPAGSDVVDLVFDAAGVHGIGAPSTLFESVGAPASQMAADEALHGTAGPSPLAEPLARFQAAEADTNAIASIVSPVHVIQVGLLPLDPPAVLLAPAVIHAIAH